jgi:hypothetical protein
VSLIRKKVLASFVLILVIGAIAAASIVYLLQTSPVRPPFEWSYNVDFVYHEDGVSAHVWTVESARVTVVNRMQTNVTIPWVIVEIQESTFPDGKSEQLDRQIGNYSMVNGFNPPHNASAMPGSPLWTDTNISAWPVFSQQPISLTLVVNYLVVELRKVESTLLIVAPREGYLTPNGAGDFSKTVEGLGCYGTGFKGSIFPHTYLEWDAVHNSTMEVGSTIKLGEPPSTDYFTPSFAIWMKSAYWYPQPELPDDSLGLSGAFNQTRPSQVIEPFRWGARVLLYGQGGNASYYPSTLSYSYVTKPANVDPQRGYNLKIVVKGDQHLFFVDGDQIAALIAHVDYGKRTAFGVFMDGYSYACFGNWYVKSAPS